MRAAIVCGLALGFLLAAVGASAVSVALVVVGAAGIIAAVRAFGAVPWVRATAMWAAWIVFVIVMAAFAAGVRSWELLILAIASLLIVFWALGGFDPRVWLADEATDRRLSEVDEDIDRIQDLPADRRPEAWARVAADARNPPPPRH